VEEVVHDIFAYSKSFIQKQSLMWYLEILQILKESDETPADCATAVVNKELQGALNAEAELEKLRKKRDEIQR
jgi:valyl-tRNA synthetase